ncbi:MAG TPA: hypothetical protein VKA67_07960, partial [Verrucomicrobiae bacterium]|nr:hypothetical protein [Verrucomicrobiae bacterium]
MRTSSPISNFRTPKIDRRLKPDAQRRFASPPAIVNCRFKMAKAVAFSLIEVLVAVALLAVIVLGLLAMFNQTQKAFQVGMAQVDVLESGRVATEMIARQLGQMTPSYAINAANFAAVTSESTLIQSLPGTTGSR